MSQEPGAAHRTWIEDGVSAMSVAVIRSYETVRWKVLRSLLRGLASYLCRLSADEQMGKCIVTKLRRYHLLAYPDTSHERIANAR